MFNTAPPVFLLVTNSADAVRHFWLPLLRQLRAAGCRILCAVPAASTPPDMAALATAAGLIGADANLAALRVFPLERKGLNPLRDMATCRALADLFQREKPHSILAATIKCVIYSGLAWRYLLHRAGVHTRGEFSAARPRFFAAITGLGYAFEADSLPKRLLRHGVSLLYRLALAQAHGVFFHNRADVTEFCAAGIVRCTLTHIPLSDAALAPASDKHPPHLLTTRADADISTSPPAPLPTSAVSVYPLPEGSPPLYVTAGVGVDTAMFTPCPFPPLPPDGPVIFLLVARLLLAKGIAAYVAAAQHLRQRWPATKARFLLLGPQEHGPGAVPPEMLHTWQTQGALEYLGAAHDVRPHIRAAHALVLPSWREGRPTAIMEGFAMGRPAIVSDAPGCREMIRHGVNGLITPVRNSTVLTAALESLILDPAQFLRLGAAARRTAKKCYNAQSIAAGMAALLLD